MRPRPVLLLACTAAAVLAGAEVGGGASAACAATLSQIKRVDFSGCDGPQPSIGYVATPGERNRLHVWDDLSATPPLLYVRDPGAHIRITAPACHRQASGVIRCRVAGNVIGFAAWLGDRADSAVVNTSVGYQPPAIYGGPGDDDLVAQQSADVFGDAGNDVLRVASASGSSGGDLDGGPGDDRLTGGGGDDTLVGDAGNDVLRGRTGDDTMYGGQGNDVLVGGQGPDSFIAGPGDDHLDAVNGTADDGTDFQSPIECGPGHDVIRKDPADRVTHCERVIVVR